MRLSFPAAGELALFRSRSPQGGAAIPGEIREGKIVLDFEWPLVKGHAELEREIISYQRDLRTRAAAVAADVEQFNGELKEIARTAITERKARIQKHSSFLEGLTIPIKRRDDAPETINMPPPVRPRRTAAKEMIPPAPQPPSGTQLIKLYDEIVVLIHTMGRGLERTPETFAHQDEESLRDHLLLMLNSHFEGNTHAEAFNKRGKTDLLIAFQQDNLFIAEFKWWSGPKGMSDALDQLYGYSTWRDSRLALIFFVDAADFTAIVEKARGHMEGRAEFIR